jgi:hypothetical protein
MEQRIKINLTPSAAVEFAKAALALRFKDNPGVVVHPQLPAQRRRW